MHPRLVRVVTAQMSFPEPARFNGPEYDPARDNGRLTKQIGRVYVAAFGETWYTIAELAAKTGDPENSVSAQLRHLRKPRFGGYTVERRSRRGPLFEYRVRPPLAESGST